MTDILHSIDRLARHQISALDERARDMLQMVALLPGYPNTVSRDAALRISSGHLSELELLVQLGALREVSLSRYTVADIFRPALELNKLTRDTKLRLTEYYAAYAYMHSDSRASIEAEYDNLRASLKMAVSISSDYDLKRLVLGLSNNVELRGDLHEWGVLLKRALIHDEEISKGILPVLLLHLARVQLRQQSLNEARDSALRALQMNPNESSTSSLQIVLGHIALDMSNYDEAESRLRAALKTAATADDPTAIRHALVILGSVLTRRNRYAEAEELTTLALANAQAAEDLPLAASLGTNLGVLQFHQGRFEEAVKTYDEALLAARSVGFREKEGALLQAKGGAFIALNRSREALLILNEALAIFDEIGHLWYKAVTLKERGLAYLELGDPESSVVDFERALTVAPNVREIEAHCRWGLSRALIKLNRQESAVRQACLSVGIFEQIGDHRASDARKWLESLGEDQVDCVDGENGV